MSQPCATRPRLPEYHGRTNGDRTVRGFIRGRPDLVKGKPLGPQDGGDEPFQTLTFIESLPPRDSRVARPGPIVDGDTGRNRGGSTTES